MRVRTAIVFVIAIAMGVILIGKLRFKNLETAVGERPAAVSVLSDGPSLIAPQPLPSPAIRPPSQSIAGSEKLIVLNQILTAHNDNDPRLDSDFNSLTDDEKNLMEHRYSELPTEKRNQRGTIVFLLARNLNSSQDFDFLKQVLVEQPCRSLSDCSKDSAPSTHESMHEELGTGVTLAYPQLVALNGIQKFLDQTGTIDPQLVSKAIRDLEAAEKSNVDLVSRKAAELLARYRK